MTRLPRRPLDSPLTYAGLGVACGVAWSLTFGPWSTVAIAVWGALSVVLAYLLVERPAARHFGSAFIALFASIAVVSGVVSEATSSPSTSIVDVTLLTGTKLLVGLALVVMVVLLIRTFTEAARHRQLGWKLAESVAAEESLRTRSLLLAERSNLAGEIHDTIGHRLAYTSLALGTLSQSPGVDEDARAEIDRIRSEVAESTEELGRTIALLRSSEPPTAPADDSPEAAIERIRAEGIEVDVGGALPRSVSAHVRTTLARILLEAAANSARHSGGAPLSVRSEVSSSTLRFSVTTPLDDAARADPPQPSVSSGTGLASLAQRVRILGGEFSYGPQPAIEPAEFVIEATLRLGAEPAAPEPYPGNAVLSKAAESRRHTRRVVFTSLGAIGALLLCGCVIAVSVVAYRTMVGVLPEEDFSKIHSGMTEAEALDLLPAVQMVEPPRSADAETMDCRYYESEVSWFRRTEVFEVCLDDGEVQSTRSIPAPQPR